MNARFRRSRREGHALRPHAQRLRPRGRPHADRGAGELPAGRRQRSVPEALRPYMGGVHAVKVGRLRRKPAKPRPRPISAVRRRSRASPRRRNAHPVTNDDGIDAPGIEVLEQIAARSRTTSGSSRPRSSRAAPATRSPCDARCASASWPSGASPSTARRPIACCSACGRFSRTTRRTSCSRASTAAATSARTSPFRHGRAARWSAALGIPAIAFSQHFPMGAPLEFSGPLRYGPELIRKLMAAPWRRDTVVNVNFPDRPAEAITGIAVTARAGAASRSTSRGNRSARPALLLDRRAAQGAGVAQGHRHLGDHARRDLGDAARPRSHPHPHDAGSKKLFP